MIRVRTIICSVVAFSMAYVYFSNNKKEQVQPQSPILKTNSAKIYNKNSLMIKQKPVVTLLDKSQDYYAEMGEHTFNLNLKNNELEGTLLAVIGNIKLDLNIIGGVGMLEIEGHILQARLERISSDTVLARINLSGEQLESPSNFSVELLEVGLFNQNKKANEDSAYDLSLSYPNDESFVEYQDQNYQDSGAEMQASMEMEQVTGDTYTQPYPTEIDPESYPQAFHNFNEDADEYQN